MAATRTAEEEAQADKVFTLRHWICFCFPPRAFLLTARESVFNESA